jgi:RecA/RadA recombinase
MTTRRRAGNQMWQGDSRDSHLDGLFSSMRDDLFARTGLRASIGTEAETLLVGLPLPALVLRYLFQSTTFPLSRITQITGEEGSAKSSFAYEMIRWHMTYGGGGVEAENELKDSPDMRNGIFAWNPTYLRRMEAVPTHYLEAWQDVLTHSMNIAKKQQDAPGGPGRTVPIVWLVDSLMSTSPLSEVQAVLKDGHAVRGFALAAQLIAKYMRTMPMQIQNYPFSIIGTNHLKPATDFMGRPTANIPGGKSVKFMETFEIEMHKQMSPDIDRLDYGGLRLIIKCKKNSLGPSRKMITAELLWWKEAVPEAERDPNGPAIQTRTRAVWDWDTATIDLLLSFGKTEGKKTIFNSLMAICDINVTSTTLKTCWSRALGIPEDSPVYYRQAGSMLDQRTDLLMQMYPILGITPRRPFQPGIDYRELLATAEAQAGEAARNLYQATAMPAVDGTESQDVPVESNDPDPVPQNEHEV